MYAGGREEEVTRFPYRDSQGRAPARGLKPTRTAIVLVRHMSRDEALP